MALPAQRSCRAVHKKISPTLAVGLTAPEGKYVRQIIVYVSKAYEVFKEIFAAPEKLWDIIRPHLCGLAGEYPAVVAPGQLPIRPGCRQPALTP